MTDPATTPPTPSAPSAADTAAGTRPASAMPAPEDRAPAVPGSPQQRALADAVREIEHHVATAGWDAPVRVFALVRTQAALAASPALAEQLSEQVLAAARAEAWHLTSVEQEGLPEADDLEHLLAALSWPPTVDGMAVTVERVVLPPQAEAGMPEDPQAALTYLLEHPERTDVRIAVGVLRDGTSWCALRSRTHDSDDEVGHGPDLVPGLVSAVRATLA